MTDPRIFAVYQQLYASYGPQGWWPATSQFEMMVGAVLTQNTSWRNVEKAISNLRNAKLLSLQSLLACEQSYLAELIRPSGYYNIKAERLLALCRFLKSDAVFSGKGIKDPVAARKAILAVKGIGPETADCILLYGFSCPTFVIDDYTKCIFSRLGVISEALNYHQLQHIFQINIPQKINIYQEYHALIVEHAKRYCQTKPRCDNCILNRRCENKIN